MRQLRLIPSGVQASGRRDTIGASGDAFAYCSTMSLHIFRLKDNALHRMIAAHERAISAIGWCPTDNNLIASCSISGNVAIWDIEAENTRYTCKVLESPVALMDWATSGNKIALALENGDIRSWEYMEPNSMSKLLSVPANGATVVRWHPVTASRLLVGTSVGSIVIYDPRTKKSSTIVGKSKTSKDPVNDAQWDPLSEDYLLVAFADGSLTLFDAGSEREIHSFDKQPQPVKSLAWAKSQPGNFATVTERVGVLRLWNVSQRSPLSQIKVGSAGVTCIKAVPSEPNWFVLAFKNSSVGVCDIATRTMRFTSSPGHSETIFDVAFHPEDPDVLATASYDGRVKLWQVGTMESMRSMVAEDHILYGLSFGPRAARICAVSNKGMLLVWRTDTGEQVLNLQVHTGQALRCEWNCRYATGNTWGEIITGGADGTAAIVDATQGVVVRRLTHPASVVGVAWHGTEDSVVATACQDGKIRVYVGNRDDPTVVLEGHEARVFNLAFHPICPQMLASGSDDKTIRVWNWYSSHGGQRELRRLSGHTAYVRGLLWHTELPHILFSGSWDATIRVWDIATSTCIHVAYEHYADVYGLTLHPKRPFLLVSTSRDTTTRFWIFEDQVRPLLAQAVTAPDRLMDLVSATPDEASHAILSGATPPLKLYGEASRNLMLELQAAMSGGHPGLEVYRKLVSFFMYRQGIDDLWGLLAVLRGEQVNSGPQRSFFHERELIACKKSKALELASAHGGMGVSMKLEERLLKAAQILLRVGDFWGYCRYMAQAGYWEKAICIAPAVSHQFWSEMCSEYLESLSASTDIEEAAPFWVATGQAPRLVDTLVDRNDLDSAFVVAKADCDGLMPGPAHAGHSAAMPPPPAPGAEARGRLEEVAASLAARYSDEGEPVKAASCFLAVSTSERAVATLSRASEFILAYVIAALLQLPQDQTTLKLLAKCAERDGRWHVAADLLRQLPEAATHLPLLTYRLPVRTPELDFDGLPPEERQQRLHAALSVGDRPEAVLNAVLVGDHTQAIQIAVTGLHELFARGGWAVEEARALLDPVESIPLEKTSVQEIAGVLACAAYVGLVEASSNRMAELMFPLSQTLRNLIAHQSLEFPVDAGSITYLEALGCSQANPAHALSLLSSTMADESVHEHVRAQCQQLYEQVQHERGSGSESLPAADGPGLAKIAGGNLPSGYRRHAKTSVLTNQLIRGPAFELEGRKLHIALTDALAWGRVNAFSPLNTGCKVVPI
eukprot:TRINITY_DN72641_c0_g1_i1.p1 TRINITY_DN72641_c0_g1~~TRINITY_DN72641_c0_g1_i1.p1  ORF type:complete len:1241 (+),score=282.97 TRINITY_DN72641_c0_g1_i1:37-3759(+)